MTERLLVARLSALGDVVFAVPAVAALRAQFPQAQIDWLVEDRFEGLVRSLPLIDEVLVFPRKQWQNSGIGKPGGLGGGLRAMWGHLRTLRNLPRYDAALDFQGNLKSSLQLQQVDARLRIGFDRGVSKEGASKRYHLRVPDPGRVPRAQRDFELVRCFLREQGIEASAAPPTVAPWPLEASAVREILAAIEADTPEFVLLHHGFTPYGRDKEWPIEHWGALCKQLRQAGKRPRLSPYVRRYMVYFPRHTFRGR